MNLFGPSVNTNRTGPIYFRLCPVLAQRGLQIWALFAVTYMKFKRDSNIRKNCPLITIPEAFLNVVSIPCRYSHVQKEVRALSLTLPIQTPLYSMYDKHLSRIKLCGFFCRNNEDNTTRIFLLKQQLLWSFHNTTFVTFIYCTRTNLHFMTYSL